MRLPVALQHEEYALSARVFTVLAILLARRLLGAMGLAVAASPVHPANLPAT